jgi:hypothetical protein
MPVPMLILLALAAAAVWVAVRFLGAWLRFRGARVVTCPENLRPAGVRLDARHAAGTAVLSSPDFQLSSCSRWPEKAGCGQECLRQIATAPEDCLVRGILARWYEGRSCVLCGMAIGPLHAAERRPGLLLPDGGTVDCGEVAAERLPEALRTAQPVCAGCHLANSFVREHPEWVTDRSRPA